MSNYIPGVGDVVRIKQKIYNGYYSIEYEEFTAFIINVNRRLFKKGDNAYFTPAQQNTLKQYNFDINDGYNFIRIKHLHDMLINFKEKRKNKFIFIYEITYMKNAEIFEIDVYSTVEKTSITDDNFKMKCIKSKSKNSDKLKNLHKFLNGVPQQLMKAANTRIAFLQFFKNQDLALMKNHVEPIENELDEYRDFVEYYESLKLERAYSAGHARKNKFENKKFETIKKKYKESHMLCDL